MGRIIVLLVVFCGLGAFTIWKVSNSEQGKDSFKDNLHTMFAIEDIDQVHRVFMVDRRGNQALVERVEELNWTYTNKQYRANPSAVFSLLETIRKVRTREPVGKPALPNAIKSLAARATKVEIYDKDKNKLRVYYVGPMTSGGTGNFMIMEGSEDPYITYIPNFQGTIDTRYITTEADWRDKAIFRTKPEALEFIQVEYQDPIQKSQSFKISRLSSNRFDVKPLDPTVPQFDAKEVNQTNAGTYVEDFDTKASEIILYDKPLRDSIITTPPFAIISYKASYHNEPQTFRLYAIHNPDADRGDGRVGHRQKLQRYFVDIDEDNFFVAQHLVIRSMLWGYKFFFQKEAVKLIEDEAATVKKFQDNKEEIRAEREERAKNSEK